MSDIFRSNGAPGEGYWKIRKEPEVYGYTNPMVYFRAIAKNWLIIALVTALAAIVSTWYAHTTLPIYKASSTLLVQPQAASVINVKSDFERFGKERNFTQTQVQIIKSRELVLRVIAALEADGKYVIGESAGTSPTNKADLFLDKLSVTNIPETNLIKISFEDSSAELAADAANSVGQQYINADLEFRRDQLRNSTAVLDLKQEQLREILKSSERNLLDYKRQNGLLDLDNRLGRLNEQSMSVAVQGLSNARMNAARIENEIKTLVRSKNKTGDLSTTVISQRDGALSQLYNQRTRLALEKSELNNRYGRRHPKVVDVNNRLKTLAIQIASNEKRLEIALEGEYNTALLAISDYETQLRAGRESIMGMSEKIHELEALEREVNTNRETFLEFFRSLKETNSTKGLEASIGRITEFAHKPLEPWKPQKALIIALSTSLAIAISSAIATIREITSDTVVSLQSLERKIELPVIGFTTIKPTQGLSGNAKKEELKTQAIYQESIRSIRSKLLVKDAPLQNRIIGITSTYPDEGKSTLAFDLARSVSELKKTLLIDCDLRLPSIHELCDLPPVTHGLTDLIQCNISAKNCIRNNCIGNLDVLTSGPVNNQASELLLSRNFAYIIDQLSRRYECVVLDCPPLTAVSDAVLIGRTVSSMLVAVKIDSETTYKSVGEAVSQLKQADVPLLGIIGTQLPSSKLKNYHVQYNYAVNYEYMRPEASGNDLSPAELLQLDNATRMPNIDLKVRT